MQLEAFDRYPRLLLRVLLALKRFEERQQHATYDGLVHVLKNKRNTVYQAVVEAKREGLVDVVAEGGGPGQKSVFGLSEKGREVLR